MDDKTWFDRVERLFDHDLDFTRWHWWNYALVILFLPLELAVIVVYVLGAIIVFLIGAYFIAWPITIPTTIALYIVWRAGTG